MPCGFFFVAVYYVSRRFYRLCNCVSICFYVLIYSLIRQTDFVVYHNLFIVQRLPLNTLYGSEIPIIQPCSKPYNYQVL